MVLRYSTFVLLVACSCAPAPVARVDPALLPSRAALTALGFFSADCHCFAAHDARLVALAGRYAGRGVSFVVVDSEVGADASRDAAEAARRGYPFPIVVDRGAKLAAQAHAVYATYSVLLDAQGACSTRAGSTATRIASTTTRRRTSPTRSTTPSPAARSVAPRRRPSAAR